MPVSEGERTALALSALGEITDLLDVGELLAIEEVEPGVVDLRFACRLPAYADWHWTVSTSDLPDVTPTVLEVELLPGDDSLLAPPWVPWTERLAEWRKQHPDERHPDEVAVDDDEPEDDAELDDDADEDDLAVDDELDELDEAELEGVAVSEGSEQDSDEDDDDVEGDDSADDDEYGPDDSDDDDPDDDRPARPGEVDRSL